MGRAKPKDTSVQSLKDMFHDMGLRSTGARVAVYRILSEAERPLSHSEVKDLLEESGFDGATIFRNLNDLVDAKLATRTDLGDHVWRFELRREGASHGQQHPHFLCTNCGDVSCLPESSVNLKRTAGAPKALSNKVIVQVQGTCDDCASASA
jgi:Fur family ferric uptake transcriptional regulator